MKLLSYLVFITTFLALFTGCKKDITSLNTDMKHYSSVPAATVFTYGEKALVTAYINPDVSYAPFRILAQEWTENTYVDVARYNFTTYNAPSNLWTQLYSTVLSNIHDAKNKFYLSVSNPSVLRNDKIVADILEIYVFHILTLTYGDIPYSQSLNDSIPFPAFDDSKAICKDLVQRLDTCISGIDINASSLGSADQIYNGDMKKWKAFAATLKLKLGLFFAEEDNGYSKTVIESAFTQGVILDNSGNAQMTFGSDATSNSNTVWYALVFSGRHDFCPTNLLVNTLKAYNDPRIGLYFQTINGNYIGGIPGQSNDYYGTSHFSDRMLQQTYPGLIMDCANSCFNLAEAAALGFNVGQGLEYYYQKGIVSSILYWGGSQEQASNYLTNPTIALGNGKDWKTKIGMQKWIADFSLNWDAWTDIRRLKTPDINTINPPVGAISELPKRFYYPSVESGSNVENWKAAVAKLPDGNDLMTTALWWTK